MFAPDSVKPNELSHYVDDFAARPAQVSIKTGWLKTLICRHFSGLHFM
jgi:hypothetical protein